VVILIDIHSDCTQVYTDPRTGQKKVTKRLGGAYPGRTSHSSPYIPPASAFGKDGQATAHFIAHGGGNALTLVQSDGSTAPEVGGTQPEFIQGGEKRRNRLDRLRFRLLRLLSSTGSNSSIPPFTVQLHFPKELFLDRRSTFKPPTDGSTPLLSLPV
jgi:hypothetical protein